MADCLNKIEGAGVKIRAGSWLQQADGILEEKQFMKADI